MKLEIGSGDRPTPGYTHMDVRELPDVEILGDAADITSHMPLHACEEIRANHVLEHFSYQDTVRILREWRGVLMPGGLLHVEVPNMAWQAIAYVSGDISNREFVNYAYGDQDYPENTHKAAFDAELLSAQLILAGYSSVQVMDIGQVLVAEARG